jgi:hypothetical protein
LEAQEGGRLKLRLTPRVSALGEAISRSAGFFYAELGRGKHLEAKFNHDKWHHIKALSTHINT